MGSISGQASGDFLLNQGALRILYSVVKNTIPNLADNGFTQSNPPVVSTPSAVSTVLPAANRKTGVLGGSVAFIRPDKGQNIVGGAITSPAIGTRPLGLFLNDALGNANENTPGPASGKGPYLMGGVVGLKLYETAVQTTVSTGVVGTALVYATGQFLYASVNGYLTNRWQDSLETSWIVANTLSNGATSSTPFEPDVIRIGVVLAPPSAGSTEMFIQLL